MIATVADLASGGGVWALAAILAAKLADSWTERRRDRAKSAAVKAEDAAKLAATDAETARAKPMDDAKRDGQVIANTKEMMAMQQRTIDRMERDLAAVSLRCGIAETHAAACEAHLAASNSRITEQDSKIASQSREIAELRILVAANTAANGLLAEAHKTAQTLSTPPTPTAPVVITTTTTTATPKDPETTP